MLTLEPEGGVKNCTLWDWAWWLGTCGDACMVCAPKQGSSYAQAPKVHPSLCFWLVWGVSQSPASVLMWIISIAQLWHHGDAGEFFKNNPAAFPLRIQRGWWSGFLSCFLKMSCDLVMTGSFVLSMVSLHIFPLTLLCPTNFWVES